MRLSTDDLLALDCKTPAQRAPERARAARPRTALAAAALLMMFPTGASPQVQTAAGPARAQQARALLDEALSMARAMPVRTSGGWRGGFALEERPLLLVAVAKSLARIDKSDSVRELIEQASREAEAVQSTGILQVAQSKVDMRIGLALARFRVGDEAAARATLASVDSEDPTASGTYASVYGPAEVISRTRLADVWLEIGDRAAARVALLDAEKAIITADQPPQMSFVAEAMASRGYVAEAEALVAKIAAWQPGISLLSQAGAPGTPLASAKLAVARAKLKIGDNAGAVEAARAAADGSRNQCRPFSLIPEADSVRRRAGDVAGADAQWRQLVGKARVVRNARERATELACLAQLQADTADKTEARALIVEAATAAQSLTEPRDKAYVSSQIGAARIRLGDREAAEAALAADLATARSIRDKVLQQSAVARVTQAWIRLGKKQEARTILAEASAASAQIPDSLALGPRAGRDQRLIASLQLQADDVEGAVKTAHLIRDPLTLAHTLVMLADALLGHAGDEGQEASE